VPSRPDDDIDSSSESSVSVFAQTVSRGVSISGHTQAIFIFVDTPDDGQYGRYVPSAASVPWIGETAAASTPYTATEDDEKPASAALNEAVHCTVAPLFTVLANWNSASASPVLNAAGSLPKLSICEEELNAPVVVSSWTLNPGAGWPDRLVSVPDTLIVEFGPA
jgi:hypothetical protein